MTVDETEMLPVLSLRLHVQDDNTVRLGAILGLGLAYAGKQRDEVGELLTPLVTDSDLPAEVVGYAALALGLVFVGTCHQDSLEAILQVSLLVRPSALNRHWPYTSDGLVPTCVIGPLITVVRSCASVVGTPASAPLIPLSLSRSLRSLQTCIDCAGAVLPMHCHRPVFTCWSERLEVHEHACHGQALMIRCTSETSDLYSPWGKMLCLGLGLLYLGKQMSIEATLEVQCARCQAMLDSSACNDAALELLSSPDLGVMHKQRDAVSAMSLLAIAAEGECASAGSNKL